ncbi:MAG: N-acetylmuramoyl-L-alanine amidase [Maribacter sp.]|jgi:N-acetylmuramoyl-L-alanine amidase
MKKIITTTFALFFSILLFAVDEPSYITIQPKSGDGIMSILRRYGLLENKCDKKQFYNINKLTKKSIIYTSKTYKLPLFIYEYDSKSIRSTIGDNNWNKAVRIRDLNKKLFDDKVKPTMFNKGKKILWVPYSELYCNGDEEIDIKEVKPEKVRNFPIFGEKHAYTPLLSSKLNGHVYYIVGGHGGPDSGATGTYAGSMLCEDEYAYDVSLRLCRKLIQHGAVAYMITRDENDGIRSEKILKCDKDETTWKGQKMFHSQKPRLKQRSNAINKLYEAHRKSGTKKQRMISIHIDSRGKKYDTDVFFYYYKHSDEGRKLAKKMQKKLKDKYAVHRKSGTYTGTVSSRDLHMLRETKPTSVYIELGNIRNPNDQKRFVLESNREVLAKWLFEGLTNFAP